MDRKALIGRALRQKAWLAMKHPLPSQLLSPWLQRGSIVMLHAQPKTYKTYLALAVAIAVSEGKPLLGWQPDYPDKKRRVLYIDAEMPSWLMTKRLRQLRSPNGTDIHILSRDRLLAEGKVTMPDLGDPAGLDQLDCLIDHLTPDLIVLDSLSALIRSGEENERSSWLPMEAWLQRQRACKRAVLMVHHQRKTGGQRGTSAREEVLDASIVLRRRTDGTVKLTIERIRDFEGELERDFHTRLKFSDDVARWVKIKGAEAAPRIMSPTRTQVLDLLKSGMAVNAIARQLGKDPKTIRDHRDGLEQAGLLAA